MKITKIEIEMTKAERDRFVGVVDNPLCSCKNCKDCPLSSTNNNADRNLCYLSGFPDLISAKIKEEPLILTEGMDCSGLRLRGGSPVLAVFNFSERYMRVIARDSANSSASIIVLKDGRSDDEYMPDYDVIRKESV